MLIYIDLIMDDIMLQINLIPVIISTCKWQPG